MYFVFFFIFMLESPVTFDNSLDMFVKSKNAYGQFLTRNSLESLSELSRVKNAPLRYVHFV